MKKENEWDKYDIARKSNVTGSECAYVCGACRAAPHHACHRRHRRSYCDPVQFEINCFGASAKVEIISFLPPEPIRFERVTALYCRRYF